MTYEERIQRALAEAEQAEKAAKEAKEKANKLRILMHTERAEKTLGITNESYEYEGYGYLETLAEEDWHPVEVRQAAEQAEKETTVEEKAKTAYQAALQLAAFWKVIVEIAEEHKQQKADKSEPFAAGVLEESNYYCDHERAQEALNRTLYNIIKQATEEAVEMEAEAEKAHEEERRQRREQFPEEFED